MLNRCTLLLLSLLLVSASAFAGVKGTLTVNGKKIELRHAYAAQKKNPFDKKKMDVLVVLSDKELPAAALHDDIELMRAVDKLELSAISVQIDPEKAIHSGMIYSPAFKKMSQVSSVGAQKLETTTWTADRVAGRVSMAQPKEFFENVFQFDATFDVAVTPRPIPAAMKGTALPAGGGDPAKAYEAYRKVLAKGDLAGLRKAVSAERAKQMDGPEFKEMLPMVQAFAPKKIKYLNGSVDGTTATLTFESLDPQEKGQQSVGTITLVNEGGTWRMQKESWRTGPKE